MFARFVLSLLAVLLLVPSAAEAGKLTRSGSVLVWTGHATQSDGVRVTEGFIPPRVEFTRLTTQPMTMEGLGAACAADGPARIECEFSALPAITEVYLLGGSAYDDFEAAFSPYAATIRGGGGDDDIVGSLFDDELEGGPGADFVDGWPGADILRGQAGRDTLRGNTGSDAIEGGTQFDRVDYSERADGVTVTLGGAAGNGVPGENDSIAADVEDASGGAGADRLTGTAGSNELIGGGGGDELVGAGGFDSLIGGPGDDRVVAQDGGPDQVTCADGLDTALVDAVDALSECEAVDATSALQPDRDADGLNAPIDCDDSRADVRPGAGDVPDNGIDEDCSGGDATDPDRDGDGFQRPEDCDDARARINPGAAEVPGNRRDEDCDGRREPYVVVSARVVNRWAVYRDGTEATKLAVRGVLAPATIRLSCKGGGCPFARKQFRAGRSAKPVNLLRGTGRPRLRPGAVVEVRVAKRRQLTKIVRYTIRALKPPKSRTTCAAPGKRKERPC